MSLRNGPLSRRHQPWQDDGTRGRLEMLREIEVEIDGMIRASRLRLAHAASIGAAKHGLPLTRATVRQ